MVESKIASAGKLAIRAVGGEAWIWTRENFQMLQDKPLVGKLLAAFTAAGEIATPASTRGLVRNIPNNHFDRSSPTRERLKAVALTIAAMTADTAGLLASSDLARHVYTSTENPLAAAGAFVGAKLLANLVSHGGIDLYSRIARSTTPPQAPLTLAL